MIAAAFPSGSAASAERGLVVLDEAGRIVFADRRTGEIFLHDRDDLTGRPFASLLAAPSRARLHDEDLRRPGAFTGAESLTGLRPDGSSMRIEVEIAPMRTAEGSFYHAAIRLAEPSPEPAPPRAGSVLARRLFAALASPAGIDERQLAAAGRGFARSTPATTLADHLRAFDELRLGRIGLEKAGAGGRYEFLASDLAETPPVASAPACPFTLGYLSEAVSRRHADAPTAGAEISCRAAGAAECRFVVHVHHASRLASRVKELV